MRSMRPRTARASGGVTNFEELRGIKKSRLSSLRENRVDVFVGARTVRSARAPWTLGSVQSPVAPMTTGGGGGLASSSAAASSQSQATARARSIRSTAP